MTFEALTSKFYVVLFRQEKEAWIKAKYVEKKFLKKLGSTEILINGERKSERRWSVKKCRRHNSATTVPKTRRRYRQEPGNTSPSTFSSGMSGEMQLTDVFFLFYIQIRHHIKAFFLFISQQLQSSDENLCSVPMSWTPSSPTLIRDLGLEVSKSLL